MNLKKMAVLDGCLISISWKSRWDDGIGEETEGPQRRTASSQRDGVIRHRQALPLFFSFYLSDKFSHAHPDALHDH